MKSRNHDPVRGVASKLTPKPQREPPIDLSPVTYLEPDRGSQGLVWFMVIVVGLGLFWHFFHSVPNPSNPDFSPDELADMMVDRPRTAASYEAMNQAVAKAMGDDPKSIEMSRPRGWYLISPPIVRSSPPRAALIAPIAEWEINRPNGEDDPAADDTYPTAQDCQEALAERVNEKPEFDRLKKLTGLVEDPAMENAYRVARLNSRCIAADDPLLGFTANTSRSGVNARP